jgi:ribosomal protein L7Ae-like RNA K-turn-binding protein
MDVNYYVAAKHKLLRRGVKDVSKALKKGETG